MKFKKTAMSVALEEMMVFPEENVEPLTEEEVKVFEDTEGEELVEDITVAVEAIEQLECLIATMEAAAQDANFGKYNLPVYQNSLESICKSLGTKVTGLSQEAFSDSAVLSTEGLKDMASKVLEVVKDLLARLITWFKNTFTSQNEAILTIARYNVNKLSKLNRTSWKRDASVRFKNQTLCGLFFEKNGAEFKDTKQLFNLVDGTVSRLEDYISEMGIMSDDLMKVFYASKDQREKLDRYKQYHLAQKNPIEAAKLFRSLSKNETDKRADDKDIVVIDSVGSFDSVFGICEDLLRGMTNMSRNRSIEPIIKRCEELVNQIKKASDKENPPPAELYGHARDILAAVFSFNKIKTDLSYRSCRVLEAVLRAGVGEDATVTDGRWR